MTRAFHSLLKRLIGASLTLFFVLSLVLTTFGDSAEAKPISMTGDYINDTVSVAKSLQETISIPDDDENRTMADKEAVLLITAYISRYRNRPEVNQSVSFTTMQTALNAMAGHYKTFKNRPIPEDLKERLNKELSQAQQLATRES